MKVRVEARVPWTGAVPEVLGVRAHRDGGDAVAEVEAARLDAALASIDAWLAALREQRRGPGS